MKSLSRPQARFLLVNWLFGFACLLWLSGCGNNGADSTRSGTNATGSAAAAATTPTQPAGPGPGEKACFRCNGQGLVACSAPGCKEGQTDCPGPCLRLNRGTWVHMNVAGHDPSEWWQKFPSTGGKGGFMAWNQHHVGEVIVYRNGVAENTGPCKICGGTTKVQCPVCKGQGKQECEICKGKKFIPVAWIPSDNPWLNRQPDLIRLRDGRLLFGKVVASNGDDQTVRTRENRWLHISASEIMDYSGTNR